ncbi:hypothetical protein, partial [Burkholderia pyrrocinia]|uniref:hypothetical protein n=1 Tax=Burkholderia pyrrocinia TaxID=60550 RepID=UPI003D766FB0
VVGISSGPTGNVTVSGSGAKWMIGAGFNVGSTGTGTLSIANGATVVSTSSGINNIGSNVTGSGKISARRRRGISPHERYAVACWQFRNGTLTITNGGSVTLNVTKVVLAPYLGSSGTVAVDGSGSAFRSVAPSSLATREQGS